MKQAEADGIRLIKEAQADDAVIHLRSLETFAKVADGKSTKIIIPSGIQDMAGLLSALKESVSDPKEGTSDPGAGAENAEGQGKNLSGS